MENRIPRRDFLKAAPAAAGVLAFSAHTAPVAAESEAVIPTPGDDYAPKDFPIRALHFTDVTLKDGFWKPRVTTNATVTIPFEVEKAGERGLRAGVLQAAIFSLQTRPDAKLQALVDARIQAMARPAQAQARPSNSSFEIAASYFRATGKRDLLDHAIRQADALIEDFRANDPPFSGGERDAMNCVQLYRVTGEKKHLDLAKHYLDIRGREDSVGRSRHNQSYKPVVQQTEAVGHAVNGVTLMLSMLDVGVLTGIDAYSDAAHKMWQDAVSAKMYVTGGVGTTGNEGFGAPFSLPNISAYAETCAVLMFLTLNHRLFLATGESKYIDVMERGMYNNAIDGVSASGNRYFYVNRLASSGDGRDTRWERASLECCPPNLVRFLASMPGYMYAQDTKGAIYVNLYASSEASFDVDSRKITLSVDSEMPWSGKTTIKVSAAQSVKGSIKLRIPGWARNQPVPGTLYTYANASDARTTVSVNGKAESATPDRKGYVTLDRTWQNGDVISIELPIETRHVVADARVREDRRRMAVERGPIVYCAEWPDCDGGNVLNLLFDPAAGMQASHDAAFMGGATILNTQARTITNPTAPAKPVRLIPYSLWANRGPGEMSVWLSTAGYAMGDTGPAGGLIFYENPNYAQDGWRYLEAAPWDQSSGTTWGCFRRAIEGARGTAIGTGKKNTADILAACTDPGTAAYLCANFSLNGVRGWFLPSRDELVMMYRNLKATGAGHFEDAGVADNFTYWASTQNDADMAAHVDFPDLGRVHGDDKDFPRRVRAIRSF